MNNLSLSEVREVWTEVDVSPDGSAGGDMQVQDKMPITSNCRSIEQSCNGDEEGISSLVSITEDRQHEVHMFAMQEQELISQQ